jgi:hypothetical protein
MKKSIFILVMAVMFVRLSHAQEVCTAGKKDHLAIGMNINNFGKDFGIGLNVTSPAFFNSHAAVRLSGNYQWLDHPDDKGNHTWSGYTLLKGGFAGINKSLSDAITCYSEGGLALVLTDNSLSSDNVAIGGYGLLGFDFLVACNASYFIELGGMGIGAKADKVAWSPLIANGFLASVGFRLRL